MVELSPEAILCFLNANGRTPLKDLERQFAPNQRHRVEAMLLHLMDFDRAVEETTVNVFQIVDRGRQVLAELSSARAALEAIRKPKPQKSLFA